jgi:HlyD family secretion protein
MKKIQKVRFYRIPLIAVLIIITAVSCNKGKKGFTFETAAVKKGSIVNTITATGTIQADTTVLIGTQVSGVIRKIYVDFNSHVRKGELLAELDKTPLQTAVQQAQASLEDSKSEVAFQTATYDRYRVLLEKNLVAQADFDQVKYNYDKARSNLKTAQAGYDKALVNLNYASIYSPIVGVVLNRAVDQGQTVAASFNTPNLFTIGNDLTQMQVQANVDEADIGQVRNNQPVDFTVDAYPNETFRGTVRQVRLQPVVTNNVVTYTVIVNAPNPEKKLMPGMTANITVLVEKVDSVLVVPAKALRFTPDPAFLTEYYKNNPGENARGADGQAEGANRTEAPGRNNGQGTASDGQRGQQGGGGAPRSTSGENGSREQGGAGFRPGAAQGGGRQMQGTAGGQGPGSGNRQARKIPLVWVKSGDKIHRVRITTGAADGTNAEIKSGLNEGDEVILAMNQESKTGSAPNQNANSNARSPFMPQRPGSGRR